MRLDQTSRKCHGGGESHIQCYLDLFRHHVLPPPDKRRETLRAEQFTEHESQTMRWYYVCSLRLGRISYL